MSTLLGRSLELSIDDIKVRGLDCKGKVTKTYKPEPNTCEVTVTNLNPAHRRKLSETKAPLIRLAAGYGTELTQLFYGEAIMVTHEIDADSGDVNTTITTTDGGAKKQTARANVTFGRNTKTGVVLQRIAKLTGLGLGNVAKIAKEIDAGKWADIYLEGAAISGAAADELSHLLRACGYDWSIQSGSIEIRKFGQAADGFAVRLAPDTGLIGSPSVSSKGVLSGKCLLFKAGTGLDLVPGRLVQISSAYVSGQFILAKCDFEFDTYADPWYCNFQAVTRKGDFAKVT